MSAREGWYERWLAGSGVLERYPFLAGPLARMTPVATDAVEVMAVARSTAQRGDRVRLLVNVAYFEAHPEHFAGVLWHEVQHVVLGHLSNPKFHAVSVPEAMELAMELSANEPITEPLPPALRIGRFATLGILPGQSTLERYHLLAAAVREGRLEIPRGGLRTLDAHRPRGDGGRCGAGLGDLLDARAERATARNWNRPWALGSPSSEAMLRSMRAAIHAHLQGDRGGDDDFLDHERVRHPRELDRMVLESAGRTTLDWARILREALPQRRATQPDYRRPNRRFPTRVGEVPGRVRRPPRPSLFAVIDTSGSMTVNALGRIARALRALSRHAKVTVAESDAAVHRVYPLAGPLGPFVGGGDTDFAPALGEIRGALRYEAVVYFTDGKGVLPDAPPPVPTLWVLTHDDPFDAPFGLIARLPDE